jgi:hypothetical protein
MRDTIEMAREAGLRSAVLLAHFKSWDALCDSEQEEFDRLVSFEALVRADEREQGQKWFDAVTAQHKQMILAEREACAKVADGFIGGDVIAERIRNRGQA